MPANKNMKNFTKGVITHLIGVKRVNIPKRISPNKIWGP
jgi:hypothetical protein